MTLADPTMVDDAGLRADRRRRLFAAMDDHDLDVLVLGRPAEIAFATGARQLWTAGSRPFGPGCVAVITAPLATKLQPAPAPPVNATPAGSVSTTVPSSDRTRAQ